MEAMILIEYESREFCKDTNCNIQKMLDDDNEIIEIKSDLKEKHCKRKCKAYEFHQWLKENGYKIVKAEGGLKMEKYKVSYDEWLEGKIEAKSELDAIQKLCIKKGLDPYAVPINDFDAEKINETISGYS